MIEIMKKEAPTLRQGKCFNLKHIYPLFLDNYFQIMKGRSCQIDETIFPLIMELLSIFRCRRPAGASENICPQNCGHICFGRAGWTFISTKKWTFFSESSSNSAPKGSNTKPGENWLRVLRWFSNQCVILSKYVISINT